MLRKCIQSIFDQTLLPQEIVIGDDSSNARTADMIQAMEIPGSISLVYWRNEPPIGQSRNVQRIFEASTGGWLVLIHDDDWLLPAALKHLTSPLREGHRVDVVFGSQLIARADGSIDQNASVRLNSSYYRTAEHCGIQSDPVWSAAIQQFPNNGYLVRRASAITVGYHRDGIGDGCDYVFGIELALAGARFFCVPVDTTVYRLSPTSVARGRVATNTAALDFARTVWKYRSELPLDDPALRAHVRDVNYRAANWCGAHRRHRMEALKWVFHPVVGVRWWRTEGLGLLSAFIAPRIRSRILQITLRSDQKRGLDDREGDLADSQG
jgi:glycosyltransferase involved in cell wall biosynthesis